MDINNLFQSSLEKFPSQFQPNELAYLALTSKPEGQLRDAIAFYMYQNMNSEEYGCAREWKHRADFAILNGQKPLLLCEYKCAYTFDCIDNNSVGVGYGTSVIKDLGKSLIDAEEFTSIYACLFLVHPKSKVNGKFNGAVKYAYKINKSLSQFAEDRILIMAKTNMTNYFTQWGAIPRVAVQDIGSAYGVNVNLLSFLIGPLSKHDVISMLERHKPAA